MKTHLGFIRPYRQFKEQLQNVKRALSVRNPSPPMVCIYGESKILQGLALGAIKSMCRTMGVGHNRLSHDLSCSAVVSNWQQSSLFEQTSLFIYGVEDNGKKFFSSLGASDFSTDTPNILVVVVNKKTRHKFSHPNLQDLSCHDPHPSESLEFVKDRFNSLGVGFDHEAALLLLSSIGTDICKLDNAIRHLSLLFVGKKKATLDDIRRVSLGLQEEHIFKLQDCFFSKDMARMNMLVVELIKSGESSLAILGVISNFCRNLLIVLQNGLTSQQLSKELRLPLSTVRRYNTLSKEYFY